MPTPLRRLLASCISLPSYGPHHPLVSPRLCTYSSGFHSEPLSHPVSPALRTSKQQDTSFKTATRLRGLSTPDTRQEHGSLKDTGKGTDDGSPSLLLWTLDSVLSLSLASTAPWLFLDASPATSGRGMGPRGVSKVTDAGRKKITRLLSCALSSMLGTVSSMPGHP